MSFYTIKETIRGGDCLKLSLEVTTVGAANEIDLAKRVAMFKEFQQIVAVDLPDINL